MTKKEKIWRIFAFSLCEIFAVITVILVIKTDRKECIPLAAATPFILIIPYIFEKMLKKRLSLTFFLFSLIYAVGPALGQCYKFYSRFAWWDKYLHIAGGVVFTFLGIIIFEKIVGKEGNRLFAAAVFGLCFSVAIAVFWEFIEFGADTFLKTDMQDDTLVIEINSYRLGGENGGVGKIENIEEVIINGEKLPVRGYIDIGLADSMLDMLLETAGAFTVSLIFILRKGNFSVFSG